MENNHWTKFYKEGKQPVTTPSSFAKWFVKNIKLLGVQGFGSLLELGAGSGRDTKLLTKHFSMALGIDENNSIPSLVAKLSLKRALEDIKTFDVIYSRFFLHCLTKKQIAELIGHISKETYFVAEFRVKGDEPIIYTDHKRYFVDMDWLLSILINSGFKIKFSQVSRDLAPFKDENPLIGRVVAYK